MEFAIHYLDAKELVILMVAEFVLLGFISMDSSVTHSIAIRYIPTIHVLTVFKVTHSLMVNVLFLFINAFKLI
jgi:hypothetical protein